MKRTIIIAALAAAIPFAAATAAGPFDGEYTGQVEKVRGTCPQTTGSATVTDGKLVGKFSESRYTFTMTGTIAADGTLTGKWAGQYPITGKFTGGHFEGTYNAALCGGVPRQITLDKKG